MVSKVSLLKEQGLHPREWPGKEETMAAKQRRDCNVTEVETG